MPVDFPARVNRPQHLGSNNFLLPCHFHATGGAGRLHADAVPWQQPGQQDHGGVLQDVRAELPEGEALPTRQRDDGRGRRGQRATLRGGQGTHGGPRKPG